jgi:hypothetical protein
MNSGSAVGRATASGLVDRGLGVQEFSLLHNVRIGSGVHAASYPVYTGEGSVPVDKAAEA